MLAAISFLLGFINTDSLIGNIALTIYVWLLPLPFVGYVSASIYLILGWALARRKRAAWLFLVITGVLMEIIVALALVGTLAEPTVNGTVLASLVSNMVVVGALLVALVVYRAEYQVKVRPGNFVRALLVLAGGFAVSLALGGILHRLVFHTPERYGNVIREFIVSGRPLLGNHWLWSVISFMLALSVIGAVATLMMSQRKQALMTLDEEREVRRLLACCSTDSLAYFSTRRDKSVFFSDDCAITYRVVAGVCLASGDPIGHEKHWPKAISEFIEMAHSYGWSPAVISASKAAASAYQAAGLKVLTLGDEAVLHSQTFRRNEHHDVERAVRRLERLGYTLHIRRHGSIPQAELDRLSELADEWLHDADERGFSMALGRLGDPADTECIMVEARFPDDHELAGRTAGLLSFVPWGATGASLDVMRRHPDAAPGVTEFMVVGLLEKGSDVGVSSLSLNFAVLREAFAKGAEIGAGPLKRAYRKILLFLSRWWQLESLYQSNDKYGPDWVPRYVCFESARTFAPTMFAMGAAEGFVNAPFGLFDVHQASLTDDEAAYVLEEATVKPAEADPVARPEMVEQRLAKRLRLLETGIEPYPVGEPVTDTCADTDGAATIAGRVMRLRDHGGVVFADIRDHSGDLQVIFERGDAGAAVLDSFAATVSIGDMVKVSGQIGASRNGTRSLLASRWQLVAASLHPLPNKIGGLKDPETRVRQRYLDLIVNPGQRDQLRARSNAIQAVRETLLGRNYLEVETPILQPVHGGANARPFTTFINAYQMNLYLRIAPELYLKRLMVGGMDRVFEIGRNFRNEGADATHNPEFTMLEAYQAHADYNVMREVAQSLVREAALAANGTSVVRGTVDGVVHEVDLASEWEVISVTDAISRATGEHIDADTPLAALHALADQLKIAYDPRWNWGTLVTELYEHLVEGTTVAPTFYTDFPADTSPLTRPHRTEPRFAERWDLVGFGMELGTAYSELTDPVIQRERLTAQSLAAAGGDPEAMELDEAFLLALEHGMPPAGGLGMGLDRLVMWLTDTSIRETLAFPLVRPR
ncbi:Lysylphosphatidylglycerol biosynthesis bifunctional protein LysX [Trueperella bialowiezensis]|uniref:Lysine--tRNA ligase n=1 Tax=Trueperella bialowiezensis TaxID=312285 RepID=A0A448PG99_9ACTO|nr:Lysylphosphatidylglycerol biosynthesis bifunctional protein LysX [Trueperella bialowiezensis]